MGKKFKFSGDSVGGIKPAVPANPQQASVPAAPPATTTGGAPRLKFKGAGGGSGMPSQEAAARVTQSDSNLPAAFAPPPPLQDPKLNAEINRRLAISQEGAAKFASGIISLDSFLTDLDSHDFLFSLSEQTGFKVINLAEIPKPPADILRVLTADQAKHLMSFPVGRTEYGQMIVAVGDPSNTKITDDLHAIIGGEIEFVIAKREDIKERVEQCYGLGNVTLDDIIAEQDTVEETQHSNSVALKELNLSDTDATADAGPVIKYVNALFTKSIKERASDIHIEPFQNIVRIRYRVDGVLREIPSPKRDMLTGIVSRIKVLSNLNISETRLPQDGRLKLGLEGREIDVRVSCMPTAHGEAVVMRILDKNMMMIGISQIGMSEEMLTRYKRHIEKPNGIVLVTGPTGCGKTTTLYAALAEIKDPGDKLITVEDPVEYELGGVIQVNINESCGMTFARALRAILRQDPDTILVGEIRDSETAQIAIQASLTGHLVFSTLHTNSAGATITRLVDMGVEPFLITSSVQAVIGQRLVRTVCPTCRAIVRPTPEHLDEFDLTMDAIRDKVFYAGEGCHDCGHSGYRGRMGLFELLEMTDQIRELILDHASTDEIQEAASKDGMITMRRDGYMKIAVGLTTFEEVARETPRDVKVEAYREGQDEDGGSSDASAKPTPKPPTVPADAVAQEPIQKRDPGQLTPAGTSIDTEAAARV